MGRVSTKNHMRTPEEKEEIVLEYLNGRAGCREVANAYGIYSARGSKNTVKVE